MSWPYEEVFHWKACPKLTGLTCNCGGDDFIDKMEQSGEFTVENNQREPIVMIANHGTYRFEAASQ